MQANLCRKECPKNLLGLAYLDDCVRVVLLLVIDNNVRSCRQILGRFHSRRLYRSIEFALRARRLQYRE